MAQKQNFATLETGFKSIQLLKPQILGIGSYGRVCKAKCDDLLCAAKIIHETLFDPNAQQEITHHREHRLPFRRFQQECEFMSAIRHPNIVQYLGMHQDPETGLPVLLMELMDDNLTHFLESSQDPVPYHIQVNFCHDIVLAISYLHSNGIIHRDLSSNNVLLHGNVIAKVTDFGMAKLGDTNPQDTLISLTMAPGTDAYMPPEAVKDQPVYTAKIDCFSIGILIIQILRRQFPDPTDRLKTEVQVSEIERRQNHISQVDPNHPLLPIALHCLKDSDVERPSAQELCHRVAALKETPQYKESTRSAQDCILKKDEQIRELLQQIQQNNDIIQGKDDLISEKDDDINELKQHSQQVQGLQKMIGFQDTCLKEKDDIIQQQAQQIQALKQTFELHLKNIKQTIAAKQQKCQQLRETINDKDRELQRLTQQLQTSKQVTAQFQSCTEEVSPTEELAKPQLSLRDPPQTLHSDTSSRPVIRERLELSWRKGKRAPCGMCRGIGNAVVNEDMAYFIPDSTQHIYSYDSEADTWNQLPDCITKYCSLAVVNNLLTTIGGAKKDLGNTVTNQIFSLIEKGSKKRWKEVFAPMPTKRDCAIAVCTEKALIVAGGWDKNNKRLKTVEVMDIEINQWSTVADLPEPLSHASGTICGDRIYMLGGRNSENDSCNVVYTCSLAHLLPSYRTNSIGKRMARTLSLHRHGRSSVWNKVADLPVTASTCATLKGRLLAIGGCENGEPSSDIRIYNATFNQWETISKMTVARSECFVAVLPNKLMVVGGYNDRASDDATDSVEIATVTIDLTDSVAITPSTIDLTM